MTLHTYMIMHNTIILLCKNTVFLPLFQKSYPIPNLCKQRSTRASQNNWRKQFWHVILRAICRALKRDKRWCHSCNMSRGAKDRLCISSGPCMGHCELVLPFTGGRSSWAVTMREACFGGLACIKGAGRFQIELLRNRTGIQWQIWGVNKKHVKVVAKDRKTP